tara:strand:- start:165719 stop:165841 length:123 start_codon:yes stop_codon:yes gene_type:complete
MQSNLLNEINQLKQAVIFANKTGGTAVVLSVAVPEFENYY